MKIVVSMIVALGLFLPTMLISQWQQTNGPSGGPVNTMTLNGTTLFAGFDAGICRSTDNGATWTNFNPTTSPVREFGLNGTTTFAGTNGGVYRTTDNGLSWSQVNNGLLGSQVSAFTSSNNTVFVGTDKGVFRSTDNGMTWSMSGNLSFPVLSLATTVSTAGLISIYAGLRPGAPGFERADLYQSTDNGLVWNKVAHNENYVQSGGIEVAANRIFFGDYLPLTRSIDAKMYSSDYLTGPLNWLPYQVLLWAPSKFGLPNVGKGDWWDFGYIIPHGGPGSSRLYAWLPPDLTLPHDPYTLCYASGVDGWKDISWNRLGLVRSTVPTNTCIIENGSNLFVCDGAGVHKSTDNGVSWVTANQGISNGTVQALALLATGPSSKTLFAASGGLIFSSTDNGSSWIQAAGSYPGVQWLASGKNKSGGNNILAASSSALFLSTDGGLTWNGQTLGGNSFGYIGGLAGFGTDVFICSTYKLYRSTDGGVNWVALPVTPDQTEGPIFVEPSSTGVVSLVVKTLDGFARTTDNGSSWVKTGNSLLTPITGFTASGAALLVSTNGGVLRSLDHGASWSTANEGLENLYLNDIRVCGSRVFASTVYGGVFVSLDDGSNWTPVNSGLANLRTTSLTTDGSSLYVGTAGSGVLRFTGSFAPVASLTPVPSTPQAASGTDFLVEVKVGDPTPINDLGFISFYLSSDQSYCTYVDSTATYGPFLTQPRPPIGTIVPLSLYWKPGPQTVSISLTWQLKPGMSGQGVVAKARFKTADGFTGSRDVKFSLSNLRAMDSGGNPIELWGGTATVHVLLAGGEIWPGDCNNDGVVNAADVLPVGVYYGKTMGIQNKPGISWQGYLRDGWPSDNARKNLLADANGDGTVNSVDVLAIGLNYGKTHQPVVLGKTVSPQMADGVLQVGTPENIQAPGGSLRIPITLKSTKPVYGVAFDLKYGPNRTANTNGVKLLRIDTSSSMLGGGLMLNRISDQEGSAEIGMTRVQGIGIAQGSVVNLLFDAPPKSPLWVEVSNVIGNDEHGNTVNLVGSVFRSDAEGASGASSIPTENALLQNYPNPFNPTTTIRFQLSDASVVSVKMFDILGREVATLVNEERAAGSYTVRWDATGVPSGIYCCRLSVRNQAGQVFTQTRRMTIVK